MMTVYNDELYHHGIKGMKWGIRKKESSNGKITSKAERLLYSAAVRIAPREIKYKGRRLINHVNDTTRMISDHIQNSCKQTGVLSTNKKGLKAVESVGIETHKNTKYSNLNTTDIARFKTYTDSARYSRGINGYLAIGQPQAYEKEAKELKESLRKNNVDSLTVYRSCNFKFSINGVAKKLDQMSEDELSRTINEMSSNFKGKSVKENRVFSTSTSPLFAIDTWREVNPTAASTYNTYMVINCKKCPGILADGRTDKGEKLVNTRSNQEAILAPNKLVYRDLKYDEKRKMFAITVDAE